MRPSPKEIVRFQRTVFGYYKKHGREFPWRSRFSTAAGGLRRSKGDLDPYSVLVSEVMLQQTQVDRVIPKYREWMTQFPTPTMLARAPMQSVLRAWSGLGYNRRALYLKSAAEIIAREYGGKVPRDLEKLRVLPGIGSYTAAAILAFAWNEPAVFVETNIRTVYLHFFFKDRKKVRDEEIFEVIEKTLPKTSPTRRRVAPPLLRGSYHPPHPLLEKEGRKVEHPNILKNVGMLRGESLVREWYSALMDYGAMLKKKEGNANVRSAHYTKQKKFAGSRRELRGKILRRAARQKMIAPGEFASDTFSVSEIFAELVDEGFLKKQGKEFRLA